MAHLTLTPKENEFLRQSLIMMERHFAHQVDIDWSILSSPITNDKSLYERMLTEDTACLEMAKSLYIKFIRAL